jgi:GNAT superfamily N-acetyltransferase
MVDPPHGHPPDKITREMSRYSIERGQTSHVEFLQAIELAAGVRFRDVGMADIAAGDPTPNSILQNRAEEGRLFVALDRDGTPVGFLIWSQKDGRAYIEEVSVHTEHAGHKLAARMIDALANDVRGRVPLLSLTTFRDVPWNAPYYASLGFTELPSGQAGPEHELSWRHQTEAGLDMSRRLFMVRTVQP